MTVSLRQVNFAFKGKVDGQTDKLTDCSAEDAAGSSGPVCCMVKNVLSQVTVDTASGSRTVMGPDGTPISAHELEISGLFDAHRFRELVWKMKRGEGPSAGGAPGGAAMTRGGGGGGGGGFAGETVPLLEKQIVLLEESNRLLGAILAKE